ncbi:hypothetical protein AVEN_63799-1 [Araneus ventricosus]|uniref:Reverse transcriptase domain-containing protein n=1 Tax=Araneus ventricosus TaxID=182803 RepID=A0A4Y2LR23_ARAVE|nr:hypothetical protein AVEN_63799-1 [Araneus ventricosus]
MKYSLFPLDYSTENEFLNKNIAISKTKNSTPGADNIPPIWFKQLDDASLLKILGMLQQQLDSSVLPKAWKHTIIIPIPKPNKDKTKLTSYRPIALTSVFCKIFERILAHRITHFLTSQKKLNPNQHGFLPFRDNHTEIYKIYSAISEARKNKKLFVAVSLDIKTAYNSVHVDDLILKCLQLGDAYAYIVRCGLEKATSHSTVAIIGEDEDLIVILIALAPAESDTYFMKPSKGKVEAKIFSTRKQVKRIFFCPNHPPSSCIQWLRHNISNL